MYKQTLTSLNVRFCEVGGYPNFLDTKVFPYLFCEFAGSVLQHLQYSSQVGFGVRYGMYDDNGRIKPVPNLKSLVLEGSRSIIDEGDLCAIIDALKGGTNWASFEKLSIIGIAPATVRRIEHLLPPEKFEWS